MKKNNVIDKVKIPLETQIKTTIELGALSAALDCGLLEDGRWNETNDEMREDFLDRIYENVTKGIIKLLKDD